MKKTCALTGHRELPADFNKNALYEALENLILEGCDTFLCGMAEGFDLLALECLSSLRQKYRIFTEACIPYQGREQRFSSARYRALYFKLLPACDKQTILSDKYFNGVFLTRDRYMVDHCDVVFAYCNKECGGTYYTVSYAKSKNIPVRYFEQNP